MADKFCTTCGAALVERPARFINYRFDPQTGQRREYTEWVCPNAGCERGCFETGGGHYYEGFLHPRCMRCGHTPGN